MKQNIFHIPCLMLTNKVNRNRNGFEQSEIGGCDAQSPRLSFGPGSTNMSITYDLVFDHLKPSSNMTRALKEQYLASYLICSKRLA